MKPTAPSNQTQFRFYEAIAMIQSPKEAEQFFYDLCTPAEIQSMADRWLSVEMIKAGKPYRKIYEETGVSSTTVVRVARFLNMGAGGYEIIYNRLKQKKVQENENK